MSTLSIALSPPQFADHYAPGERLKGVLTVTSEEQVKFKSLDVSLGYLVVGELEDREIVSTISLMNRSLSVEEHDFAFELPSSPCSYKGQTIDIKWFVSAQLLELSGATSVSGPCYFTLRGGAGDPPREGEVMPAPLDVKSNDRGWDYIFPSALVLLGMIAFLVWFLMQGPERMMEMLDEYDRLFIVSVFSFVCCFGWFCYSLGGMVHRWLAVGVLDFIHVEVEPWPLRVGGSSLYTIDVTPKRDLMLNVACVRLSCVEIAKYKDVDGGEHEHNRKVFEQKHVLSQEVSLVKGERVQWTALIELPTTVPMSFELRNSRVEWTLETTLDILNWPDWKDSHGVKVCAQLGEPA